MGDRGFDTFYREFLPTLVGFLVWQGAGSDAQDMAQEAMTRAYRAWDQVQNPAAWTRTVAFRAWLRHRDDVRELAGPVPDRADDDVTGQERWEQHDPVLRLLARLPDRQRQVLAWSVDGYTPTEIAAELDLTPDNVRQNLSKARRSLQRWLAEEGIG